MVIRGSRGEDTGSGPPPLKNHNNIGFLSNTGPDPQKNHKPTKPAFNVGPSSGRQRNAIYMAGFWTQLRRTNTSKKTDHGVNRSANFVHQQIMLSRISIIGKYKTSVLICVANLSSESSSTTIVCI